MDSCNSTEEDHESKESSFSTKNAELKKANRALWKRIEELQKEKISVAEENAELKRKIELSPLLPGNPLKSSFSIFQYL